MESDDPGRELRPGDVCVHGGLYEVIHLEHRTPHNAVVSANDVFPPCKQCGANVRFRPILNTTGDESCLRARAARKRGG